MKNKKGFTLAETMITLGIIGIIAAVTIPTIKNIQPNQEMILLKKSYYNISRIVGELINDEDFYPEREDEADSGFSNVTIHDQIGGDESNEARFHGYSFSGASKFCGLFASKINTVQSGDPNNLCTERVSLDAGGNFSTPDGVTWSMPVGDFNKGAAQGSEEIYIDVNGPDKGDNCSRETGINDNGMTACSSGVAPDRFAFRIDRFGGISIPSRLGQLYATSSKTNKSYHDFVKDFPGQIE